MNCLRKVVCSTSCCSLPATNTFTTFIHVVFISGWLENESHQTPKIYILSETFLSCSFTVSFDQWPLCRGPLISQRTSGSAGLVNGSALGQNIPIPANHKESEDMHRACPRENGSNQTDFSVQREKAETFLSHPSLFQCGTDHLPLRIWFLSWWWRADPWSTPLKGENKNQQQNNKRKE